MRFGPVLRLIIALAALVGFAGSAARADEGMWTFDHFPADQVEAAYGVRIDQAWLDHVRAGSVRLTTGCSASIVSRQGLVFTNHHCVVDCIANLATPEADYLRDGFLTSQRSEERKCAGVQAEVLTGIFDITTAVNAATAGKTGIEFSLAREATTSAAEQSFCGADPRVRCQTMVFFRGGQYQVYRYRKYDDVRLVFAPEFNAAFFGGDPDNFNFPRYNLDAAFLRLYEAGHPAPTPEFLRWKVATPLDGDPVFVSGNPGMTERQLTVAQLETMRDLVIPVSQYQRSELRGRLIQFSTQSGDHRRIATDSLFGIENSFKVFYGRQFALNDRAVMTAQRTAEAQFRARVAADPQLAAQVGDPWAEIAAAQTAYADLYMVYRQLEVSAGANSDLFRYARTIVRGAQERTKPSGERLAEFADARLPLVEKGLFDERRIDPELERLFLGYWLAKTREYLTVDAPSTVVVLGSESPEALADRLVAGTRLADPAYRRALWEGGFPGVLASEDPLIQFVLKIDPLARVSRRTWEDRVTVPTERAAERIARARFAIYGDGAYPDGNFSLRLSYGRVAGWSDHGDMVTPFTTLGGFFNRATGADPYQLPPRWLAAKDRLDLSTVLNFTTTNDIIGGNSGSPALNAKGEVIGSAFDGNIHSLGGDYFYDGALNRTIVVSTAAITMALDRVYGRTALLRELME